MEKSQVFTGSPWEPIVGYCRAIRIGDKIEVAGTTSIKDGEIIGIGNAYEQTRFILQTIEDAINELGADISQVVRTRIFVTDISKWEEIGKAHGDMFRDIQPVSTVVEVKALIDPRLMVEIEATAICK